MPLCSYHSDLQISMHLHYIPSLTPNQDFWTFGLKIPKCLFKFFVSLKCRKRQNDDDTLRKSRKFHMRFQPSSSSQLIDFHWQLFPGVRQEQNVHNPSIISYRSQEKLIEVRSFTAAFFCRVTCWWLIPRYEVLSCSCHRKKELL